MTQRVLRWEIPVDDLDHELGVDGPVVHVAPAPGGASVDFWTVGPVDRLAPTRRVFRVFGTGQPIPTGYVHRGTAARTADALVWHLFERAAPDQVHVEVRLGDIDNEVLVAALRRAIRSQGPDFLGGGR